MNILGLNAFHGDASAAVLQDGQLIAALEEERLNRIKHWAGLPLLAAKACLQGTQPDHIAISRNPKAHLADKLLRVALRPRRWASLSSRAANSARIAQVEQALAAEGIVARVRPQVHFVEHHRAHLASAFFASPFDQAAVISIDGFGDLSSVMWGVGKGNQIQVKGSVSFPHSLGIFYTALTQYLGFPKYGDEYKVMGLGSYGEPEFLDEMRRIAIAPEEEDRMGFALDPAYFLHHRSSAEMTWDCGEPRLGRLYADHLIERLGSPRDPADGVDQRHRNLAASLQRRLEEVVIGQLRTLRRTIGLKQLCMAGGVAF